MIHHPSDRGNRHRRGQVYHRSDDIGDGQRFELDDVAGGEVRRLMHPNVGEAIGGPGSYGDDSHAWPDTREIVQLARRFMRHNCPEGSGRGEQSAPDARFEARNQEQAWPNTDPPLRLNPSLDGIRGHATGKRLAEGDVAGLPAAQFGGFEFSFAHHGAIIAMASSRFLEAC